jgi:hypothetical protein
MASLTLFIIVAWWQGLCWHGSLLGFLGKWGGEREKQNAGESSSFFPCSLRVQGKKKAYGAVQNGTVCLFLFFFFETVHETAPFYPKRAVSFKRKWRQSMSNLKLRLQFARVFSFWSLVLDFFNQVPNWPPDFNMYAIKPLI